MWTGLPHRPYSSFQVLIANKLRLGYSVCSLIIHELIVGYTGNVHHVIALQWKKPANYLECVGGPAFVGVYKLFSEKVSELQFFPS